ncbi:purine-binding chemotaxis protein CheW [Cytobacillus oceanisediminis]|jgi:purine-binding chemotaxis protein CheW|uniref:Purine-binding chemotaxis protein CheW n=1 Tax=Cytobacillus oceanisediminis TaxID=665099 RepID=A0A2V2ZSK5_9BACI|nr:chemotaxis protein CheW [Cytobacillus oceanisediminis]PWW27348.1 purine-binding chemotaxis protein CheW [Cytobacillus oceanisediminis]
MTEAGAADLKLIVFQLKNKEYAIPVNQVRSIEKVQHITRVPRTAGFVKGVINLRGVVTPIISLRSRFNLEEAEYTDQTRVIITVLEDMEVGLIVDSANDVIDVSAESVEPPPETAGTEEADFIKGVTKIEKRLMILIDLEKVLNPDELAIQIGTKGM